MMNLTLDRFNMMVFSLVLLLCTGFMVEAQDNSEPEPPIPTPAQQAFEFEGYTLEVKVTNSEAILVADDIEVELTIIGPEAGGVQLDALGQDWGEFEVLGQEALDDLPADDGLRFWSRRYVLTRNDSGVASTGELRFDYRLFPSGLWKTYTLEPLVIEVQSVLEAEEQDPKVIRAEQDMAQLPPAEQFNWAKWLFIGLAAIVSLIALLIPLIKRLWPRHQLSIEDKTLQAIRDLQAEQLIEEGQFELFYTRLTDIVRAYIEEAFGLKAPNQTTPEFLVAITQGDNLLSDHADTLANFMQQADMVKFAGQYGDGDKASAAAKTFITQSAEQMRERMEEMKKLSKGKPKKPVDAEKQVAMEGVRS